MVPVPMCRMSSEGWAKAGASPSPRWHSNAAWHCSAINSPSGVSSTESSTWHEENGRTRDPVVRQGLAQAHIELAIMRYNTLRSLAGIDGPVAPPEASIAKLYWGTWHRRLGELSMNLMGMGSTVLDGEAAPDNAGYGLNELQRSFLFARSETIYGGSNEIQRNIIGERVLGLPPEPKGIR